MSFAEKFEGLRTLAAGFLGMILLLVGFWLCPDKDRAGAFLAFAGGVGAIVSALVVKSVGTAAVSGDGLKKGWENLTTPAKPGDPAAPPAGS